jgi:hypothetical protein
MAHEVGDGHEAAEQERHRSGEEAHQDQQATDKFENAGHEQESFDRKREWRWKAEQLH